MAARNSLTDKEAAIIKTLLRRGKYQNQEIAGMINRSRGDASKDISTGRISNIKNDQIQKYIGVEPASDGVVDAFLEAYNAPPAPDVDDGSPFSSKRLAQFFPLVDEKQTHFNITETDQIECKRSHNLPMKTIAAFANNKGGYFALGVENRTWEIVGLPEKKYAQFDFNQLNQNIRSQLGIAIDIQRTILDIGGKRVALFYVAEAHTKPVIFIKSANGVSEGHIYFRYPGEDRLISPSDLQKLIEDRLRKLSETILSKHISNILRVGPENAAVLDLMTGNVEGKAGNFVIDENLLTQLSFIREGEFTEVHGSPALKLIGHLSPANTKAVIGGRLENIRDEDLIEGFLKQESVTYPDAYIKRLKYSQRKWLPVYYFIRVAGITAEDAIAYIEENGDGRPTSVQQQKSRLQDNIVPKEVGSLQSYEMELERISGGADFEWDDVDIKGARRILYSLRHLQKGKAKPDYLLKLLNVIYNNFYDQASANDRSIFIMALATVDALLFRTEGDK